MIWPSHMLIAFSAQQRAKDFWGHLEQRGRNLLIDSNLPPHTLRRLGKPKLEIFYERGLLFERKEREFQPCSADLAACLGSDGTRAGASTASGSVCRAAPIHNSGQGSQPGRKAC